MCNYIIACTCAVGMGQHNLMQLHVCDKKLYWKIGPKINNQLQTTQLTHALYHIENDHITCDDITYISLLN